MWNFEENGKSTGPVSTDDIATLINAGRLFPYTRVWREGMADWQPANRTELAPAFSGMAPPPLYGANTLGTGITAISSSTGYTGYAGFWIRLAAYLLDAIFVELAAVIIGFVVGAVIGLMFPAVAEEQNQALLGAIGLIVGLVIQVLYFTLFPAGAWQATPGKRIVGIHIVRADGRNVSFGLALGRYLAYIPSSAILGFGFFMIGWTDQKKGLHDMICATRVMYGKPQVRTLAFVSA